MNHNIHRLTSTHLEAQYKTQSSYNFFDLELCSCKAFNSKYFPNPVCHSNVAPIRCAPTSYSRWTTRELYCNCQRTSCLSILQSKNGERQTSTIMESRSRQRAAIAPKQSHSRRMRMLWKIHVDRPISTRNRDAIETKRWLYWSSW